MPKIALGGWYQRTTLHLSEVHVFMMDGTSKLPLDKDTLKKNQKSLNLKDVRRSADLLDVLIARTKDGIEIRYYEDGLYVFETTSQDIKAAEAKLKAYYEKAFKPAIAYIFSLGAPTPKSVANITDLHPFVITVFLDDPASYVVDAKLFGKPYQTITSGGMFAAKTETHIVIAARQEAEERARHLMESHIFFREFKDQLGKYLFIHRTVWEDISRIKDKKAVRIAEAARFRAELEQYRSTVNLIWNRINQMGAYVNTRASIVAQQGLQDDLRSLFAYRFEVLLDTLEYIKEIWRMTDRYLQDAIDVLLQVENQGTKVGIQSLRAITTFGVVVSLVNFLWQSKNLTSISKTQVLILLGVVVTAYGLDRVMRLYAERASYQLTFKEQTKF